MIQSTKTRFDDYATEDVSYHGFDYRVTIDKIAFEIRTYDDELGEFTVIRPTSARDLPQTRQLVDYLIAEHGCQQVRLYNGPSGTFCLVDLQTLDFKHS